MIYMLKQLREWRHQVMPILKLIGPWNICLLNGIFGAQNFERRLFVNSSWTARKHIAFSWTGELNNEIHTIKSTNEYCSSTVHEQATSNIHKEQSLVWYVPKNYSDFPKTPFEHLTAFQLSLIPPVPLGTSYRLPSRSWRGILLGAGARAVKDKASTALN